MNDASDAPEAVLTSTSQKEVVYQPPQSPLNGYHPVQQSPGEYPQQQYQQPPQQHPQYEQQQQQQQQHQYEQQQQQQQQQYEVHAKPFEGSGYYHNAASSTSAQYYVPTEPHQERKQKKTVCGLARRSFICLVILAIAVVIAAVAGAVGGSWAVQ